MGCGACQDRALDLTINLKPETQGSARRGGSQPEGAGGSQPGEILRVNLPTTHSTLNTQHSTLNSQFSTLNTQHSTPNTQSSTTNPSRKVDIGYLAKGIQTPMAQGRSTKTISMVKWIRTSKLSIKNSPSNPSPSSFVGTPLSPYGIAYRTGVHHS